MEIICKGVDYSTRPTNWDAFYRDLWAAGYSVVGRYLSPFTKGMTPEELQVALRRGFEVFPYYETSEQASLGGFDTGRLHANQALTILDYLGLPRELPVCYTVDFDASASQLQGPVRRYFEGVRAVVPASQIGVYGGYHTVNYVMTQGLASWAVQTEAWSRLDSKGRIADKGTLTWHPKAAVHQWTVHAYQHGKSYIQGVSLDVLDIVGPIPTYPTGYMLGGEMTEEQWNFVRKTMEESRDLLFSLRYTVGTNTSYRESINNALLAEQWELAEKLNDEAWSRDIVTGLPKGWRHG